MLGPWWGRGDDNDVVTVFDGIDEQNTGSTTWAEGCKLSNTEVPHEDPEGCGSDAGFGEAVWRKPPIRSCSPWARRAR
jgi:beta-glucosidase